MVNTSLSLTSKSLGTKPVMRLRTEWRENTVSRYCDYSRIKYIIKL